MAEAFSVQRPVGDVASAGTACRRGAGEQHLMGRENPGEYFETRTETAGFGDFLSAGRRYGWGA
ncbi:MAG TPA: hypothetical protein P5057_02715 [Acidobacteriota bacterium]|nr:hypothetical protein [Acidobacteriota bacterium]HRR55852.1 hypothetical protein [Acidobacteriota bacterium]